MFGFKGKILMMNKKYEAKNLLTEEQFWKIYQANCIKMNKSIHKLLNIIEKTQEKPFL